ncbi:hypothetical protein NBRC116583_01830 [Arenicella sp. 4NH20-0111]|uniref:ABC transporter substrate-binding protein n=1 Tax=Arenicella sp. 4NH20-0111 TaxID=3127648 RepID=UPI0031024222
MKRLFAFSIALLSVTSQVSFSKPQYVSAAPLDQVVKTRAKNVKDGTVTLPIITWGGDIATIHANGNKKTTASGSIFDKNNVRVTLKRQDVFTEQLEQFIGGDTPYLRGTLGMINAASDLLNRDKRTKPVVIYQLTWSAGGDALVVKDNIKSAKDLRGKTIALQAYGPHVDYLAKILNDAGLSLNDVSIKWLSDLTGTDNSPMNALYENNIDAAFVIIPDALALTSGGNVGTGAEDSVKGAKILLSTKTANRVISDVYAVRSDYLNANKEEVSRLVRSLIQAQESVASVVKSKRSNSSQYQRLMRASAEMLLDSPQAIGDAEGLYADAEFTRFEDNIKFFQDARYPRNFERLNKEIQNGLSSISLITGRSTLGHADWDFNALRKGLTIAKKAEAPRFNEREVAKVVTKKQQQGALKDGELFSFEVFFKPNQQVFTESLYSDAFDKVMSLASTYGGAIITVEGHSDPMGYLRKKKENQPAVVLGRIKQSAKNLSVSRAQQVRDNLISYSKRNGVSIDSSQFAVVGHGIAQPKTGVCNGQPCAPKTETEWRSNMRVEFRIIQVEAEADVFSPL